MTDIYLIKVGEPIRRITSYTITPRESLICFYEQKYRNDYNWWLYPMTIDGLRESRTKRNVFYLDVDEDTTICSMERI